MVEDLELKFPVQGWQQFLSARLGMLSAYDVARQQAREHEVQVFHGRVAESRYREWLINFLPQRYGITSGYIVSPSRSAEDRAAHFDVIIYDQLEAPVLWVEDHVDSSKAGYSRAIPVEHVLCVLEVKSALTAKTAEDTMIKLSQLSPLMAGIDKPDERYKRFLRPNFCCGAVFFELRTTEAYSETALLRLATGADKLRSFMGALVLRGEGHAKPSTGRINILASPNPIESLIRPGAQSLLGGALTTSATAGPDGTHTGAMLMWAEMNFAQFAFDILAIMQGTFEVGRVSSWYGMGQSL